MVAGIPRNNVSTDKNEWCTPPELFKRLDEEFDFDLDAAATNENTLCTYWFTKEMHTFDIDWSKHLLHVPNISIFLNPPYGRGVIEAFVRKAYIESTQGATVVCLLPFSGARWFRDYCLHADEIRILGRVKYIGHDNDGNLVKNSPTFDSCIVIFRPGYHEAKLTTFRW
jgi:phage N-6-adenine-methyltransferase